MSTMQGTEYYDPPQYDQRPRIVEDAERTGSRAKHTPITEQIGFRAALYLQDHPRQRVTASDVMAATGLGLKQAQNVMQKFTAERTDVERVALGVYVYTPGKGPGIKPKTGHGEVPVVKSKKAKPAGWVPSPNGSGALVKQPEMFYEIPDAKTRDGRRIIRGWDGIVYAITELA